MPKMIPLKLFALLFITGLTTISCSYFNPPAPGTEIQDLSLRTTLGSDSEKINLPAKIVLPENGGSRIIALSLLPQAGNLDRYIITRNHQSAVKLFVNDILVDASGSFPPHLFVQVGRYLIFRIPGSYFASAQATTVELEYYTDSPILKIEPIYEVDIATASYYENFANLFNTDIYRYFAFLCLFIFIYSFVQFLQRPTDRNSLFFALFNLFIGAYFFGMGMSWVWLPFLLFLNIFKGCLFLAFSALLLFCISFTGKRMPLVTILASIWGLSLFLFMVFANTNTNKTSLNFRIALLIGTVLVVVAFVFIIIQFRRGQKEIRPLAFGGLIGLAAGLCDTVSLITNQYPLFWMQGVGIFIFLISVFLSLAGRTTRMHKELEGYAMGIQAEVERRTDQLNTSNLALSRASKAKSDFLAHMSHEIRTPLNCIMGFAQILEQRKQSEIDRYYIGLILRESNHLMQLISQILDLSRIEQGKLVLDAQNFHIRSAFNSVIEGLSPSATQKGLQLEIALSEDLPEYVFGDQLRFQQILINLLGNSIKFTHQGKVRLEARSIPIHQGDELIIEVVVSDTGIGIESDKLETIFNRFEQADSSITRKYGGTGLGITIARDLVHLMNGEIHIASSPAVGTRVNFTVRLGQYRQAVAPANTEPFLPARHWHFPVGCKVLVVDDYVSNLEVVRVFLNRAGIVFIDAQSGIQALEVFRDQGESINAILMDIHMPGMDGWETTRQIRQMQYGDTCPIIALTADAFEDTAESIHKVGIQDILTKPLHYETLMATLAKYLLHYETGHNAGPERRETPQYDNSIIDYRHLSETYFGDESIITQLLSLFLESGANLLTELKDAIEDNQISVVHLKAHALKGGALNVGAVKISISALHLEQMAKKQAEPVLLKSKFEILERDWAEFAAELSKAGIIG